MIPPQSYLQECFHYDPLSGELTWKHRPRHHFKTESGWKRTNSQRAGKSVSLYDKALGYRVVGLTYGGVHYADTVHRWIWKLVTGKTPVAEIDHRDTDRSNNQWVNLREASVAQNRRNSKMKGHNTTGLKGVSKMRNKFQASIMVDGVRYHLGTFSTPEAAHIAYAEASKIHHGEFGRVQ